MKGLYHFSFPTNICFGVGAIKELPLYLIEQQVKKPLLVTDPILRNLPLFQEFLKLFDTKNIDMTFFSDLAKNPIKKNVLEGAEKFISNSCDCIIGFGGGVAMDVARAIALKVYHDEDLFHYEDSRGGDQFITGKIPLFITVPTTSGTGSEVGRSTVISDDITHEKKIIFSPRLIAKKVFADPALTLELSPAVTAATGMDALTHHVESFLAQGFNPMCDGIALEGARLITENLTVAVNKPTLESRSHMMMAALMGAVAFQKGLGVVHSMAHALSTHFDFHHGYANAIMLPYGLAFNAMVAEDRMQRLCAAMNLKEKNSHSLINYIKTLTQEIGLDNRLSSHGINESHIELLATTANKDVCHQNNPRLVNTNDFVSLFREAL